MTIRIGEYGAKNLENWGYCVGYDEESDDTVVVKFESADVHNDGSDGPDVEVDPCTLEPDQYEYRGNTVIITEESL